MKRRVLSLVSALILIGGMLTVSAGESQAAKAKMIEGSYLTQEEESIGYDTKITRGEDLLVGYSKLTKLGPGKIYAGGTTVAAHEVKEVGIAVILERAQEGDTTWSYCDSWQKFLNDTDRVASNRAYLVERGYYYRVRCIHSANSDVSSSFTNGLLID